MSKRIHAHFSSALYFVLVAAALAASSCSKPPESGGGTPAAVATDTLATAAHGAYLATIMGCHDCHTPGASYGAPDFQRALSGSDVGWSGPWGVSYPRNLTPDPVTGLGAWTEEQIIVTLQTGKRPDGTSLLPPMPWPNTATLKPRDIRSLAKYLKSILPVTHSVPAALPPGRKPTTPVITLPPPPPWDAPRASAAPTTP
ncbi:MAG TPA: cytochrome c [Candidatus Eisenbacteria bacterium]|nr:cytochrome c [Candidatus Eisenbacteria bacterium]